MGRRYFGTDGMRGLTNVHPMTPETVMRVGQAAGAHFLRGDHKHRVVIGKDTRLSGYMMESALIAGFTSVGMDVIMVGPIPTPAVSMLTKTMRADMGVMISASHNAFRDNGIKLFGPDGFKLSDEDELQIEALIEEGPHYAAAASIGRSRKIEDARGRYIHFVKSTFPDHLRLDGLKVVVDSANGAAYTVASAALWELGAEVFSIGDAPNGTNINADCGSTYPEHVRRKVAEVGADLGLALDGDGDRLIVVDEKGNIIDGDQLMAAIGLLWARKGRLKGGAIAATVMSNLGLEHLLKAQGIDLVRSKVGDRYVLDAMRKSGCNVGGEQSGHIILSDYVSTGDAIVAALQILVHLIESNKPASEALAMFTPLPQILKNVRADAALLDKPAVRTAITANEKRLTEQGGGRLLIRKSGTEPVIRVMAEGEDSALVQSVVDDICAAISKASTA